MSETSARTEVAAPARVRLTADRVRRWQFSTPSFTRRGYDSDEVDRFRIRAADELDLLATEIARLRAESERLAGQLELHRHGVIPSANGVTALPTANEVNLLSEAQREAERIMAQAHEYAHRVAEYARAQYDSSVQAAGDGARREAQRAMHSGRRGAGVEGDDVARNAAQIAGEAMISQIRAVARHLDDGRQQLTRALERLGAGPTNPDGTTGGPGLAAPPRTGAAGASGSVRVRVVSVDEPTVAMATINGRRHSRQPL
ncbi:DivIVA domain-containing protein [Micromonospora sp. ATA51]|uniref:DivIVA domain-containing protein n=1 Tax=Micromonospora sp. ATA51 TaxID=2806098 RepID=UPI001A4B48A8|nr:DivIVA domain-containing protein [Micromonospora sp. ATA51]MBM0224762.1 DivIVA domain-containing protein [Micromonospora sp. ATA51]